MKIRYQPMALIEGWDFSDAEYSRVLGTHTIHLNTPQREKRYERFANDESAKIAYIGGTSYKYSLWALRFAGGVFLFKTPYDFTGRWMRAKCRTWNRDLKIE